MAVVDEESRESITVCLNGDQETDSNNRRYKIGQEFILLGFLAIAEKGRSSGGR